MMRSLSIERESFIKDSLLIMGSPTSAYNASIFITIGLQGALTSLVAATMIGLSCFPHTSGSLVCVLFVLFGLASLSFAFALLPLFRTARNAYILGPFFYLTSTFLYFLFLTNGQLTRGMRWSKLAASLLPTMGFYLASGIGAGLIHVVAAPF